MYFQQLDSDVATISKSAKGRVLFFDADGVCLLGLSETAQIQMNFDGGYIYIFQDGGGTSVFNQGGVPNTPMEVNCSFYKFTVVGLTDIDGRPFTALVQPDYDQEVYKAKVREAYEYLVGNIFVGCCNTGTDSILWYADEASFPATGLTDTLYVDKATPALFIWNGSAYVAIAGGSGGGVASVTGYSVDNTDAVNPIVKAVPTAGTDAAEPVTGDIEVDKAAFLMYQGDLATDYAGFRLNSAFTGLLAGIYSYIGGKLAGIYASDDAVNTVATSSTFQGIKYGADHRANFVLRSLIDLETMKSRFWTKAGAPTTSDDSTQGYIVGSLIQDTTNSILYECTDNTAGAAVWAYADIQSEIIRAGAVVPASSTRWLVSGLSGFSTSVAVNIAEKAIHTTFRVMLGSAQPASGSLTITRDFTTPTGTLLQSDSLVIAAGSAVGEYNYTGASFDATATSCNIKFICVNASPSSSGSVQGVERNFTR
jgi:hypothetical protein